MHIKFKGDYYKIPKNYSLNSNLYKIHKIFNT